MLSLKKLSGSGPDKQTRVLVAVGLVLAVVVFMLYTKPRMDDRDAAREALVQQQKILKSEKEGASKFLEQGAERDKYVKAVSDADSFFPFIEGETKILELSLQGVVSQAANRAGVKLDAIPSPAIVENVPGVPQGVSAFEITISMEGSPGQFKNFVRAISDSKKVYATMTSMTATAVIKSEAEQADLRSPQVQNIQGTIRMWFTTTPPLAGTPTTTTAAGSQPSTSTAPASSTP
jgi:type II secretory pathway component PulM